MEIGILGNGCSAVVKKVQRNRDWQ